VLATNRINSSNLFHVPQNLDREQPGLLVFKVNCPWESSSSRFVRYRAGRQQDCGPLLPCLDQMHPDIPRKRFELAKEAEQGIVSPLPTQ
jgi:hypothetical protein